MGAKPRGYSASRVAAILNLNAYQTPIHIWQILMEERNPGWNKDHDYELPLFTDNPVVKWGKAFENAIISLAESKYCDKIIDQEKFFNSGLLTCHIDGAYSKMDNGLVLHEGKTTNARAFYTIKDDKLRWGESGTDEVPEEYQIQAAVQRICTGADLVRLSVLVFPKPVDEFEELGWLPLVFDNTDYYSLINSKNINSESSLINFAGPLIRTPMQWAQSLNEMGFFYTYDLPKNKALEEAIIKKVVEFDENHIQTGIPPKARDYDDIRRLLKNPIGTIIATPELKAMATEYSEITRQIGSGGPMAKRREQLKVEILDTAKNSNKDDWSEPYDKLIIIDPDGGTILASFTGSRFTTKRAK
jgi:hypothetical protein